MPSFDVVCQADTVELRNAVDQSNKEISNRFDFKGSDARIELGDNLLTIFADDDFKASQVRDVLLSKCARRKIDVRFLDFGEIQKIGGDKVKQLVTVRNGVSGPDAKRIVKLVKDSKLKVQASIQGDSVRISGAKKDVLQEAIALVREKVGELPLSFENFRD
jgi:uncharacterized protein YajQ (UPF0234 family)